MKNFIKVVALIVCGVLTLGFGLCSLTSGLAALNGGAGVLVFVIPGVAATAFFAWIFFLVWDSFKSRANDAPSIGYDNDAGKR